MNKDMNLRAIIETDLFYEALFNLIVATASELPGDVVDALKRAEDAEKESSVARLVLSRYLENLELARIKKAPLCQDTGIPLFFIRMQESLRRDIISAQINKALEEATRNQYLRPNAVDPITGRNSGINVGKGFPVLHFDYWDREYIEISLILKGGGSENVSCQYSLPYSELKAGRDLEGVRRVVLEAVKNAEGKGCPPGILGICIGGDRESGYLESKRQFLRTLNDTNPDPVLAALEKRILNDANSLWIGPQGLGGQSTLLGVKIGTLHRLPACYFVTISYMCWAFRRRSIKIGADGQYTIT